MELMTPQPKAIIFDTETHAKDNPIICEAAYIGVDVECVYNQRFNPGVPMTLSALSTHHITDEMVADCPLASEFSLPESVRYIIGHNIDFDWNAIGKPDVKRICTLALARCYWPELDSHTQSSLLYHFFPSEAKERIKEAHSALVDVLNLKDILNAMKADGRMGDISSISKLWEASEKARIPKVMPFGKHLGELIANIPLDYKQWLLKQPDMDEYLVMAIKNKATT